MRFLIATAVAALVPATWAMALTQSTVSFQYGADGYTAMDEMRISMTASRDGTVGTAVTNYLIDGWATDDPLTTPIEADSPDEQELIRFDNIIGAGAIPQGATILGAQLIYRTYNLGTTANSGGPWGVAALNQPFTSSGATPTRHADFPSDNGNPLTPSRGPWFQDTNVNTGQPYATRPVGAFAGPHIAASGTDPGHGTNIFGGITEADVWPLVQRWADDPTTNHGMTVQAGWTGVTNGWGFFTNGAPTVADRPKLSVTYTTSPIAKNSFQQGVNGYTSGSSARLDSGADLSGAGDDVTLDGNLPTSTGAYYIDGQTGTGGIFTALYKFGNVFGSNAGQAPADKPVAKAWLVLTTGTGDDQRSPGPFLVHQMLRDWDTTSTYSGFGAVAGFQEADGDIGPALDSYYGATNGQEVWFDVTGYAESIRGNLGSDKGLAVLPGTNDGWASFLNGATNEATRPRLVVYSDLSTVAAGVAGDFNNNGVVDAADYVVWRNAGATDTLPNDPTAGTVDATDYATWKANFGKTPSGSGSLTGGTVPEPTAGVLGLIAMMAVTIFSRKRSS
jgi:hypothetical protein